MKFYPGNAKKIKQISADMNICLCHIDYNHCVANNENGEIPNIIPNLDLHGMNFTENFVANSFNNVFLGKQEPVTTTTQKPEEAKAMGFEVK